jgi:hypothetical protein
MSTPVQNGRRRMARRAKEMVIVRRVGFSRWVVAGALALLGAVSLVAEGAAQVQGERAAAAGEDSVAVEDWIGRWSGPFESEGELAGFLVMIVAHNDGEWVVESELLDDGAPPGGEVREWILRGDRFSYRQSYEEVELIVLGQLAEGEIVGEMEAQRDGEKLGVATFNLRRVIVDETPTDDP